MPGRVEPILTGEVYHTFNRTLGGFKVFSEDKYSQRFLDSLRYYRSEKSQVSFSAFKNLFSQPEQQRLWNKINIKRYFKIDVLGYSLMPNHFHLLLYQKTDKGISKVLGDTINSFTRYFNLLNNKEGPLFLTKFKATKILTNEQLIYVLRYILLNPYSSRLIDKIEDLIDYKFSSFREHLENPKGRLTTDRFTLPLFNDDPSKLKNFIFDNAEYQKTLEQAKHTEKWL